jgi:signal peptide peptidase SppA
MPSHILASVIGKVWMIEQNYVQSQIPFLANLLDGKTAQLIDEKTFSEKREALRPFVIGAGPVAGKGGLALSNAAPGSIAVINLTGALMKQDQWCGPEGTATIAGYIKEADANPNISAIILNIDSPGGTVDGTETLANTVKAATKPVVAFVDGMAASAAYWIASACSEIIASSNTDIIGSIGTQISFLDILPSLESRGIKFHEIQADESFNKNVEFREALKGNYKPLKENLLNPTNKVFVAAVTKNREGKLDMEASDVLSGAIYLPKQAIKVGLIDHIGDFNFAVTRATELSRENISSKEHTMKITVKGTWNAIKNILGISAEVTEDTQHDLTAEQLQTMNEKIASATELEQQIGTLNTEKTELQQEISRLKTENEQLKKAVPEATETVAEEETIENGKRKAKNSWDLKAEKKASY